MNGYSEPYLGKRISTWLPRISSSRLNPDTTSPRPPACMAGAHSDAIMITYTGSPRRFTARTADAPLCPPSGRHSPSSDNWVWHRSNFAERLHDRLKRRALRAAQAAPRGSPACGSARSTAPNRRLLRRKQAARRCHEASLSSIGWGPGSRQGRRAERNAALLRRRPSPRRLRPSIKRRPPRLPDWSRYETPRPAS